MKTIICGVLGGALLLTMFAPGSRADGYGDKNSVRWETIIGIIQAGNVVGGNTTVSPPIPGISGGGQPWSTLGGQAYVNLTNSVVTFEVKGLVLAGGNSIGTPATITQVEGTLVCNPGATTQAIINTPPVTLDAHGNASFNGSFSSSTDACSPTDVAFLITIPSNGHWIANGAVAAP